MRGVGPSGGRADLRSSSVVFALILTVGCGDGGDGRGAPPGLPSDPPPSLAGGPTADSLEDAAGRTHRFEAPPERIVSLVPSASAMLVALGASDRLVGRTDFDTARALAHLPSVGGGLQADLETLLSLRPDLVIRFAGPSDEATTRGMERLGIVHFAVRPDGIQDLRRMLRQMGALTGRDRAADSLLAAADRAMEEVRREVAGRPPVRTAYLLGGTPPWAAGPGTYIDELIRLAGGVNVFADLDRLYAPVSREELLHREVDVYLTSRGSDLDPKLLRGVPVRALDPSVELPSHRIGEAAREVARALHPGVP